MAGLEKRMDLTEFEFHISPRAQLVATPDGCRQRGDDVEDALRETRILR